MEVEVLKPRYNKKKKISKRPIDVVDTIVIHHSAGAFTSQEQLVKDHIIKENWSCIGYHYLIKKSTICQQLNSLDTITPGATGHNLRSIHICVEGNYEIESVDKMVLEVLIWLVKELKEIYDIRHIKCHGEVGKTLCCGRFLISQVDRLRSFNLFN